MNFVSVLNAASSLLDICVPQRRNMLNADNPVRYLIIDPTASSEMGLLRDRLINAPNSDVIYFNTAPEYTRGAPISPDLKKCFDVAELNPPLICVIALADETDELLDLLNSMISCHCDYYEADQMINGRFKIVCCRIFRTEDITGGHCQEKARKLAPRLSEMLNRNDHSYYPAFCMLHAYWKTITDPAASMARLGEQIIQLVSGHTEMLTNLQNNDFSAYRDDDYPWCTFGIKETHAQEIPLFKHMRNEIENQRHFNGPAEDFLIEKAAEIQKDFLQQIHLPSLSSLGQNLKAWCVYMPVSIAQEEYARDSDLIEKADNNQQTGIKQKKWNLLWKLFSKKQTPEVPKPSKVSIGKQLMNSTDELCNKFFSDILQKIPPQALCNIILRHCDSIPDGIAPGQLLSEVRKILPIVFGDSSGNTDIWKQLMDAYSCQINEEMLQTCLKNMDAALGTLLGEIDAQLNIWSYENEAKGADLTYSISLQLRDEVKDLYSQLVKFLNDCCNNEAFLRQYPRWDVHTLTNTTFAMLPDLNLVNQDVFYRENLEQARQTMDFNIPETEPTKKLRIYTAILNSIEDMKQ